EQARVLSSAKEAATILQAASVAILRSQRPQLLFQGRFLLTQGTQLRRRQVAFRLLRLDLFPQGVQLVLQGSLLRRLYLPAKRCLLLTHGLPWRRGQLP